MATVGIVDSFTIFARVSVAEMLHIPSIAIPSLKNPEPCKKSRMASDRVELRCGKRVPWRAERRTAALSPLAACKSPLLQVAVAAWGCDP
jgi:hypothetical protein